jgi:3-hydroxy-5-methyl-1-naphthoate 3-O-methyltransferase
MDIWEIALGFMDSQALLTAEKLGLFAALDEQPLEITQLASRIGLPEDSTERLVTALAAMGVLHRSNGHVRNTQPASEQLVPGKPAYIGSLFRHVREDLYPVWTHLEHALREQKPQWERQAADGGELRNEKMHQDPEALRAFLMGMHSITSDAGIHFSEMWPGAKDIRSITDVGGAAGSFLISLSRNNPKLRGVIFDLPHVRPIAEDLVKEHGLSDRISFHPGDFFADPIPAGSDAYSLGFVLHDWDDNAGSMLLWKIHEAARPGATLILGEYLLTGDRSGPLRVARQDLNMLVAARGRERSMEEYIEWMDRCGFEFEQVFLTRNGKNFLIARRKD